MYEWVQVQTLRTFQRDAPIVLHCCEGAPEGKEGAPPSGKERVCGCDCRLVADNQIMSVMKIPPPGANKSNKEATDQRALYTPTPTR